jgi:LAS superfamily LD-carboxypeptidase LdcB
MDARYLMKTAMEANLASLNTPMRATKSLLPSQAQAGVGVSPTPTPMGVQEHIQSLVDNQTPNSTLNPSIGNKVDALAKAIGTLESGGNYKIKSKVTSAAGKYQYVKGTWNNYGGYATADQAPPEVQDKRFKADMTRLLTQYNGDVRMAAVAHFQGEGAARSLAKGNKSVLSKSDANGMVTSTYADKVAKQVDEYLQTNVTKPLGNYVANNEKLPNPTGDAATARLLLERYKTDGSKNVKGFKDGLALGLAAMIQDAPGDIRIYSGFRSIEHQKVLWEAELKKRGGNVALARKWVAPPGNSQHNHGNASDLKFENAATREWAHKNASKYGLIFPLSNEDWHIETAGARK